MHRTQTAIIAALLVFGVVKIEAQTAITIQSRLVPKSVYAGAPSQLIITVKGGSLAGLTLRFRATRGFHVTPAEPKFVLEHYYWVDFAVTLTVGFLALAALMKNGRPPASAEYWPEAIVLGVGLGLLTNSDLLTRVHA